MRPIATDVARCVVRLCLRVGHTDVLCKTAEPQVCYFGVWTHVDLRNHYVMGVQIPLPAGMGTLGGGMCPTVVTRLRTLAFTPSDAATCQITVPYV